MRVVAQLRDASRGPRISGAAGAATRLTSEAGSALLPDVDSLRGEGAVVRVATHSVDAGVVHAHAKDLEHDVLALFDHAWSDGVDAGPVDAPTSGRDTGAAVRCTG